MSFWPAPLFAAIGLALSAALAPVRSPLLLCLAFVAPLLAVFIVLPGVHEGFDSAASVAKAFSSWHWIAALLALSTLTFRIRDVEDIDSAPVDGWALFRIALECIVALALAYHLVSGKAPWLRVLFRGTTGLLSGFVLLSAASVTWSVEPAWTLFKSLEYGVCLALVAAMAIFARRDLEYSAIFDWYWGLIALALAAVWIGALIDPTDAFSYGQTESFRIPELSGVWPMQAANSVGDLGALLSVVAVTRLFVIREHRRQKLYLIALSAGLTTMVLAQCRSAIAGFVFGMIVLLVVYRRVQRGAILAGVATLFAAAAGLGKTTWTYLLRNQQQEQFSSLSGRVDWWTAAWAHIARRPLIGFGGFAGGRFLVLADAGSSATADIHSTFVETLLDTGVPGLLLVAFALAAAWWILWRGARSTAFCPRERGQCIECLGVLGVLSVRAFFSTTLVAHSLATLTFLLIVGYSESIRRRLGRRQPQTAFQQPA